MTQRQTAIPRGFLTCTCLVGLLGCATPGVSGRGASRIHVDEVQIRKVTTTKLSNSEISIILDEIDERTTGTADRRKDLQEISVLTGCAEFKDIGQIDQAVQISIDYALFCKKRLTDDVANAFIKSFGDITEGLEGHFRDMDPHEVLVLYAREHETEFLYAVDVLNTRGQDVRGTLVNSMQPGRKTLSPEDDANLQTLFSALYELYTYGWVSDATRSLQLFYIVSNVVDLLGYEAADAAIGGWIHSKMQMHHYVILEFIEDGGSRKKERRAKAKAVKRIVAEMREELVAAKEMINEAATRREMAMNFIDWVVAKFSYRVHLHINIVIPERDRSDSDDAEPPSADTQPAVAAGEQPAGVTDQAFVDAEEESGVILGKRFMFSIGRPNEIGNVKTIMEIPMVLSQSEGDSSESYMCKGLCRLHLWSEEGLEVVPAELQDALADSLVRLHYWESGAFVASAWVPSHTLVVHSADEG
jgi:hypothetical protein